MSDGLDWAAADVEGEALLDALHSAFVYIRMAAREGDLRAIEDAADALHNIECVLSGKRDLRSWMECELGSYPDNLAVKPMIRWVERKTAESGAAVRVRCSIREYDDAR